ncbi:MAG: phosphoribosylamine--glycine ligase [Burkholderiaceae bacterium]|nr:phosphoribosylamine--glycine ligase [Burkholderiaceae bacterium]
MAWRLARSRGMDTVYVAPGNAGTALEPKLRNVPLTAIEPLALFAEREKLDFTVVGPEAPLAEGIVDVFRERGLPIFGPTRAAAQLESSKDFAKAFMARHGIPTADYRTFTDPVDAKAYISGRGAPIVVKADGLAAGKGVVVATTVAEAHAAVDAMLGDGQAGGRIVVEEFLQGEEASFIVMVDGRNVLTLASSQDHKRLKDGDQGPNTGGMGAYSPAPLITPDVQARTLREIIVPVVAGMAAEGMTYTGFLYAGLMIDRKGDARTLEFNCRLGDPEAQVILARMKSDFGELIRAGIEGRLDRVEAEWDRRSALCVVLAAQGYPEAPRKGMPIAGIALDGKTAEEDVVVFHAGTAQADAGVVTAGGRVLGVTALGDSLKMAHARAYEAVRRIHFPGMQFRSDIGHQALPGGAGARR